MLNILLLNFSMLAYVIVSVNMRMLAFSKVKAHRVANMAVDFGNMNPRTPEK